MLIELFWSCHSIYFKTWLSMTSTDHRGFSHNPWARALFTRGPPHKTRRSDFCGEEAIVEAAFDDAFRKETLTKDSFKMLVSPCLGVQQRDSYNVACDFLIGFVGYSYIIPSMRPLRSFTMQRNIFWSTLHGCHFGAGVSVGKIRKALCGVTRPFVDIDARKEGNRCTRKTQV